MADAPAVSANENLLLFELQQAYDTIKSSYNIIAQFVAITFTAQAALIGFAVETHNPYLLIAAGCTAFFLLYQIYASNRTLSAALVTALSIEHQLGIAPCQSMASALIASLRGLEKLRAFSQVASQHPAGFEQAWTSARPRISIYGLRWSKTIRVILALSLVEIAVGVFLLLSRQWAV